jgi:hypothetical protein
MGYAGDPTITCSLCAYARHSPGISGFRMAGPPCPVPGHFSLAVCGSHSARKALEIALKWHWDCCRKYHHGLPRLWQFRAHLDRVIRNHLRLGTARRDEDKTLLPCGARVPPLLRRRRVAPFATESILTLNSLPENLCL